MFLHKNPILVETTHQKIAFVHETLVFVDKRIYFATFSGVPFPVSVRERGSDDNF